ncbi:DUF2784 domain-containing protein [Desulfovibrio ferrophilus]|uniref:DUF2784 domain-containing protein n=1 Tax=Desulfovibrio ferrophilus TaxID=241368 RepID=A0A2Z6AW11_9BACT|nr:DUF2784 domain-containing protein [Desulfovibrio ferrophilus]BBD07403.1 putative uncharacterized protein [Desulfovibrio ferrophilus]
MLKLVTNVLLDIARDKSLGNNQVMSSDIAIVLADLILALHWAFAAFISMGLGIIWLGKFYGWKFIRSRWLRLTHLGAMGIVVGESLLGVFCPLTEWEHRLRRVADQSAGYETTFMDYWAEKLFYWDIPTNAFMLIYILFFALMLITWRLVPPYSRPSR